MSIEIDLALCRKTGFKLSASLHLEAVGFTGLFGPSGCGKTTFLRCIAGLESGATGRIVVGGEPWFHQKSGVCLPAHKRRVGYVFQDAALFPHLSVRENILYGYKRTPADSQRLHLEEVAALSDCTDLLDRGVQHLSGGERQRVAIARALLPNPALLLLDEPLASLDAASRRRIVPLLKRLHKKLEIPVLYVTHNPQELAVLADTVALFEAGRLVESGDVFSMLARSGSLHRMEADALCAIAVRFESFCKTELLARYAWQGGQVVVPMLAAPEEAVQRLVIHARDVSLVEAPPAQTSILNIFPVTVTGIENESGPHALVRLDAGGAPLLARVTRYSAAHLGLHAGKKMFAQVKSVALSG